jgi:Tol biopolymer transport system component/DNA-binding winged helix-turn-helix (wHTH) protein
MLNVPMNDPSPVRFGAFELDLRTGELRKHGIRLKLQDQPFQVLQALVERPGELVTREEIQRRIWADGTFVDFDQSLNRAVNKVREALGDTADNPRYIETMARRGYRFIAPVEGAPKPVAPTAFQAVASGRPWGKIAGVVAGVLAVAGAGLWVTGDRAPLLPPRLVPLTTYPGSEGTPAFSPDGKHVAFAWDGEGGDNFDVYVKMVGNVTALRLTSNPAYDGFPAWSPDGRQIAFYSARGGGGIYLVSPDGGPERKLTDLATNSRPAWAADGKYLVVSKPYTETQAETGDGALFLAPVESEGSPRQFLAAPSGTWYKDPAFAPDSRSLAFASCMGAQVTPSCSLQVAELQAGLVPAGKPRQIARPTGDISGVAWMPDGSSLIYSVDLVEPSAYLWRVNVRNGKAPERVELAGADALDPAIDLKAGRLAFSRRLSHANLWRLERGGIPAPFLTSSSAIDANPQYSPDGRRIAFGSSRQGTDIAIWVANADGTGPAQITHIGSPYSGSPRWSPDGRWLAFDARGKDGGWDVWAVEASGSSARQLTHGPADNAMPSWSRDGSSIYLASKRSGRFEIWRIPAGGGTAVQMTHTGGHAAFESTDGKTLYYTLSAAGDEGLYAKLLPDGEEKQVVKEGVAVRGFAVFSDGVYYLHRRDRKSYEIRFHEFAGGQTRVVSDIEAISLSVGLTVSPDRKTFLFSKWSDLGRDLMLIENFR